MLMAHTARAYAALLFQFYQSTFRRKRKSFISWRTVFCVASLWLTIFVRCRVLSFKRHNNNIYWTARQIYFQKNKWKNKMVFVIPFFFLFQWICLLSSLLPRVETRTRRMQIKAILLSIAGISVVVGNSRIRPTNSYRSQSFHPTLECASVLDRSR